LAILLAIGFGSLGLFPTFYSLTQEISAKHQGLITGALGFTTWVVTSYMQEYVGKSIDKTGSYATGLFWAGQVPIVACLALALFWGASAADKPRPAEESHA
jgi:ACS family hexuronate transporter-like MFS transporter